MDDPKTIRVLKLVILLCGGRSYSINELMNRLVISDRTVYRDIATLESAGFTIEKQNGRYHIDPSSQDRHAMKIFYEGPCDVEERNSLYHLELGKVSEPDVKYNTIPGRELNDLLGYIKVIMEAIHARKKINLLNYRSSNGGVISDRKVEPYALSSEKQSILAFDPKSKSCKTFKITRLNGVKIIDEGWEFESQHTMPFIDIFNLSAESATDTIHLEFPLSVYNLIIEEFPASKGFITGKNPFTMKVPVAGYEGVGRFVLGLIDSIKVINPEKFKTYLGEKMQSFVL